MNEAQLMIEMDRLERLRTGHVLHLLLSIITFGVWTPIWIIIALNNAIERGRIERRISK